MLSSGHQKKKKSHVFFYFMLGHTVCRFFFSMILPCKFVNIDLEDVVDSTKISKINIYPMFYLFQHVPRRFVRKKGTHILCFVTHIFYLYIFYFN